MVDRDLIVERQPFQDRVAECSEPDPPRRFDRRPIPRPLIGICVRWPAPRVARLPAGHESVGGHVSRICWQITLCWEGLPGKPSNATADLLITRKNDSPAEGLYERKSLHAYPHHA